MKSYDPSTKHRFAGSYSKKNADIIKKIQYYINVPPLRRQFIPNVKISDTTQIRDILKAIRIKLDEYMKAKNHPSMFSDDQLKAILNPSSVPDIKQIQKLISEPGVQSNLAENSETLKQILNRMKPNWSMLGI